MKALVQRLFLVLAYLTVFSVSNLALAQTGGGQSSRGSSSSAGQSQPSNCPTKVNNGGITSGAPNPTIVEGTLVRENCENGCVTGTLKVGDYECNTLELEWNDNLPNKSCIPVKKTPYVCRRVNSPKFGNTFEVTGVNGRTHILFHAGNTPKNTSGCILLGMEVSDQNRLVRSREAVKKFLEELQGYDQFKLTIIDKTGTCSSSSSRSVASR
jgi:hypothetical protein